MNGNSELPPILDRPTPRKIPPVIRGSKKKTGNELVKVEKGYCTFGDLFNTIRHRRVSKRFKEKDLREYLIRHEDVIPLEPGVVVWKIPNIGRTSSRGLDRESCTIALKMLRQDGYIQKNTYRFPPRLGNSLPPLDLSRVEVFPNAEINQFINLDPKERWVEDAKKLIASLLEKDVPPDKIIQQLVEGGHRSKKLTTNTLRRQMRRMVPKYYSKEQLQSYGERHNNKTRAPKRKEPKGRSPGKKRAVWAEWQYKALGKIATDSSIKWSKVSGRINCEKIARILKKEKIRQGATYSTVRNALACLIARPGKRRYGLTTDLYERINNPKKYFSKISPPKIEHKARPKTVTEKTATAPIRNSVQVTSEEGNFSFDNLTKNAFLCVLSICMKDKLGV